MSTLSPLPPSLKNISNLVGNISTGISKAYGAKSIEKAAERIALHTDSPLKSLHGQVGTIMQHLKGADPKVEHHVRSGGLTEMKQRQLLNHLIEKKAVQTTTQKKAAKLLLSALGSQNAASNPQVAAKRAATVRNWQAARRMEESSEPKAMTSIYDKTKTTTFQTRGDQVVRGNAGQPTKSAAGSIKDLLNRRPSVTPSISKPLGGGMNPNFRPRV